MTYINIYYLSSCANLYCSPDYVFAFCSKSFSLSTLLLIFFCSKSFALSLLILYKKSQTNLPVSSSISVSAHGGFASKEPDDEDEKKKRKKARRRLYLIFGLLALGGIGFGIAYYKGWFNNEDFQNLYNLVYDLYQNHIKDYNRVKSELASAEALRSEIFQKYPQILEFVRGNSNLSAPHIDRAIAEYCSAADKELYLEIQIEVIEKYGEKLKKILSWISKKLGS